MKSEAAPVIGLVGLGLVGTALAQRLWEAGWRVMGFDIQTSTSAAFVAQGGELSETLREMATQVSCVVLAVFDTQDVLKVIEGERGLCTGGNAHSIVSTIIDCSTGIPDHLQALALRLKVHGIDFIEAPLSGSSVQIRAGEATMLLGGDVQVIANHESLLQTLAWKRIHVGSAGMGAQAKLATNLVLGLNRAALAEGMVFAQSLGIAPSQFLQLVLATPARSDAAVVKGEMMVKQDYAPQSRIRQHLKDVHLMIASAQAHRQKLPFSQVHAQLMQAAVEAGDGELDNAAIIEQLRREKF